tara:strand:- start:5275 stop:6501 length:1227 start_codon:yes stop_codon:yes gene_type:complete
MSSGVEDPSSEHAEIGSAAHTLAEICMTHTPEHAEGDPVNIEDTTAGSKIKFIDAWEKIGNWYDGSAIVEGDPAEGAVIVDDDMATAVQVYLDEVDERYTDRRPGTNFFVEHRFHVPEIHEMMYGTSDLVYVDLERRTLHIWDYKNGAGIVVEAPHNLQLKYYAVGVITSMSLWDKVDTVVTVVAQPNGYHYAGPIREFQYKTAELAKWMATELQPAMELAMVSRDTKWGKHCRFCPARLRHCPAIAEAMDELEEMTEMIQDKEGARKLKADEIARYMELFELAKIVNKAVSEVAYARLEAGNKVPGYKLVSKRANRAFRAKMKPSPKAKKEITIEQAASATFGDAAFETKLKTPAQIEKLPGGDRFCRTWAFKPDTGRTVAPIDDNRSGISRDTKSLFKPQKPKRSK